VTDRLREEKEVAELLERATELAESDGGVSARHCKDRVKSRFPAGHREKLLNDGRGRAAVRWPGTDGYRPAPGSARLNGRARPFCSSPDGRGIFRRPAGNARPAFKCPQRRFSHPGKGTSPCLTGCSEARRSE